MKIADFGLAREFSVPLRTYTHEVSARGVDATRLPPASSPADDSALMQIVTLWYRPPDVLLGARHYTTSVDVWSTAMIFAEMATGMPLCPGDSEIDQIFKTFRVLGTPNALIWPGLSQMPDFKPTFPQWRPQNLHEVLPEMDQRAVHLLSGMLVYNPANRISAKSALLHPFFTSSDSTRDPFLGSYSPASLLCAPGNKRDTTMASPNAPAGLMASPIA